jgi:hypothetical protein
MVSLGAGSLSHFYLRTRICGGAGKSLIIFYHMFTYHLFIGHAPRPGESFQSSGSLAVPMSVKKTRAKRKLSDEDVWEWTDARIIGMHTELVHGTLLNFITQLKARKLGSPLCTATTMSHLSDAMRHGDLPSDLRAVLTQSSIHR